MYVDETGIDTYIHREYGRSPKGERVQGKVSGKKYKRVGIVAGKLGKKIIAPLQYEGTMNHVLFELWFMNMLLPILIAGTTIVMDNASFHRKKKLQELAKAAGCKIIFLPPYSPNLNLIEHFWSTLKSRLKKILPMYLDFDRALYECFKVG